MNRIPILIQGSGGVGGSGSGGGSQTQDGAAKYSIGYDPDTNELIFEKDDVEDSRINITPTGGGSGGGGGVSSELTNDINVTKEVGGASIGEKYAKGTSIEDVLRDILNPVENPVLTPPSATLCIRGGTVFEKGASVPAVIDFFFNRGSIKPDYGTSGYRSGEATSYILNGTEQTSPSFNVTISETNNSFSGFVKYAAGEQPKNSAGEDFDSPLPAGQVPTNTESYEFVDALWSNSANNSVIAKDPLISMGKKLKQWTFTPQTAASPGIFDVPASWNVTAVEIKNDLSGAWENIAAEYDVTDVVHQDAAGRDVNYKRYTNNLGYAVGTRNIRITWN